jgi:fructose-1,6-bisphosphatase/sedoheptulose 1,7-bisphosphatase-like protein
VLAVASRGDLLHAPDTYMDKIAAGPAGRGVVSLDKSPSRNVLDLARALGRPPGEINVVVLERPRHEPIVAELRSVGARVFFVSDGDVAPCVAAGLGGRGVDLLIGKGGAPEGVLAAAALHCLGGEFQGRLAFRSADERARAVAMGIGDPDRILGIPDLVRGDVIFVASGVTTGALLRGVQREGDRLHVQSLALRSSTGTVRWVEGSVRAGSAGAA